MTMTKPASDESLVLDGSALSPGDVEHVARRSCPVRLADRARRLVEQSHARLGGIVEIGEPVYGINTGFGSLARQRIPDDQLSAIQHNLILSHASGTGEPLSIPDVRAMMLLLAASLARGHSGARLVLVESIVGLLNAGITPIVPSIGSVGASGDLAPLAHVALTLIGDGDAVHENQRVRSAVALEQAGLRPVVLGAREGLALINGTHLMTAQAALLCADLERVFDAALIACAMSIDAVRATDAFLDERVHAARRQRGQQRVAARLRTMLDGSQIVPSHIDDDPRVQDPYSFRCAPQVLGACLDLLEGVRPSVSRELGSVTDNPLILEDHDGSPRAISAGNFHGAPIAIALDSIAIAIAHIAGISERRTFALLAAADPESHLRPHLSPMPGLHSGLMVSQYTAAACCNELIGLAAPASVANIPTCAGMEDYNSFGPRAAAKARRALDLCTRVVAIELLCAAQGIEYHRPLRSGHVVEQAHATIREVVPPLLADRPPAPDIEGIAALVLSGRFGD